MGQKYDENKKSARRLPQWLKRPLPKGEQFERVSRILQELKLSTVCTNAACPNCGECYSAGTATFMIMGEVCSRNCGFCAVEHGQLEPLADDEPKRLAEAVARLELKHVVITSVTRDDLADGGAEHFAKTITAVRKAKPETTIEVLTPDFKGNTQSLDVVCAAEPDVFNHNVETTRQLTPQIRSGADYDRSLGILRYVANIQGHHIVKSGFMVGLGEDDKQIAQTLKDMRAAGVQMITIGQYLRPGEKNRPVEKFYSPEEFELIRKLAEKTGFEHVAAGPFVRSSYHAELSIRQAIEPQS